MTRHSSVAASTHRSTTTPTCGSAAPIHLDPVSVHPASSRKALNYSPPRSGGRCRSLPLRRQGAEGGGVPTHRCGCVWPSGRRPPSVMSGSTPSVTPACPSHPPVRHPCPSVTPALSVIPAEAGIHAICGVKGAPNVRRRPITRGALGALVGRRADGGSSHGWAVAWIPACAGMTEGTRGRMGMAEGWEWRKSLRWPSVRTLQSMLTVRPQHLAPRSPDVSGRPLARLACSPAHRLHAHAAGDPQRDARTPHALARLEPQRRPLS